MQKNNKTAVALRKESVDRNIGIDVLPQLLLLSLSARRAWIEISKIVSSFELKEVALRKESVDRNYIVRYNHSTIIMSLSARRAWIEMPVRC